MAKRSVLVVDDEPGIRALMAAIVARDGFTALQAENGAEALAIAERTPVDLLLTDVVMPGMSGPELVITLMERGLVSRSLMVSGYAGDGYDNIHGIHDRVPLLLKPFTPAQLIGKIREVMAPACCHAAA
jgi:CheY-like chemotaxis protein